MKKILIILGILIIALFLLTFFSKNKTTQNGDLEVTFNGKSKIFSLEDINNESIKSIETQKKQTIKISPITKFINPLVKEDDFSEICFLSSDGASIVIDRNDLDKLYLSVYEKKAEKSIRLVIPTDQFQQRWLKYINKIEIR